MPISRPDRLLLLLALLLALPILSTPIRSDLHTLRVLGAHAIDEAEMVRVLRRMREGDWLNPLHLYNYGPVTYYLAAPIDAAIGALLPLGHGATSGLLSLRLVSWFSFAAFLLLYARATREQDATTRLVPILLLLSIPEFFNYITRAHPDMPQFALLFAAYLSARKRPRVAAVLLGLAASVKFAGIILLPALLLAPPRKATLRERSDWLACFAAAFLLSQPRLLALPLDAIAGIRAHAARNFSGTDALPPGWLGWPVLAVHPGGLGGILPALGLLGLFRHEPDAARRRFALAWIGIFCAFLVFVADADYGARHLFPLLPPLLDGAVRLLDAARVRAPRLAAFALCVGLLPASLTLARGREIAGEAGPRAVDHPAFAAVTPGSSLWAEYLIDVPPPHHPNERFYQSLSGRIGKNGVPAFLAIRVRPESGLDAILASRGYARVEVKNDIEIWRLSAAPRATP